MEPWQERCPVRHLKLPIKFRTMRTPDPNRPPQLRAESSYFWLKERIDFYAALVALVLTAPLLAVLALMIRSDSRGPAVFRQARAGRNGRPFTFFKFRTMRAEADPFGDSPDSGDDPRLTRVGRRLREASLDELPQLWNVLRGEMSLVGPRPLYMQQMAEWSPRHRGRLLVKPGLTGLAQINGRGAITLEEKLEWDVRYVETASLRNDLGILWHTLLSVVKRSGIYEVQYSQTRKRRSNPARPLQPPAS
ncbi:MAG: sugar transferase [Phycisphaerae bacterium]